MDPDGTLAVARSQVSSLAAAVIAAVTPVAASAVAVTVAANGVSKRYTARPPSGTVPNSGRLRPLQYSGIASAQGGGAAGGSPAVIRNIVPLPPTAHTASRDAPWIAMNGRCVPPGGVTVTQLRPSKCRIAPTSPTTQMSDGLAPQIAVSVLGTLGSPVTCAKALAAGPLWTMVPTVRVPSETPATAQTSSALAG
jgi:hypothetical protein